MWVIWPCLDMHTVSGTSKRGLMKSEASKDFNKGQPMTCHSSPTIISKLVGSAWGGYLIM